MEAKNGRRADSVFSLLGIPLVSFKSSVSSDPCRFKSKTHGQGRDTPLIRFHTRWTRTSHRTPCRGDHITRVHWCCRGFSRVLFTSIYISNENTLQKETVSGVSSPFLIKATIRPKEKQRREKTTRARFSRPEFVSVGVDVRRTIRTPTHLHPPLSPRD